MNQFNGEEKAATYYARCNHLIPGKVLTPNKAYAMKSAYDWCPHCTKEMIETHDEAQTGFDILFGGEDGNESKDPLGENPPKRND